MITAENILSHELIGLHTQILNSTNTNFVGLNGKIIDETKSMFKIKTDAGVKLIPKNINEWRFSVNNDMITLQGNKLEKRSFDRLGEKA